MKHFKIGFALLAIIFAVASSFTVKKAVKVGNKSLTLQYFEPKSGGNIQLETGWKFRTTNPGCTNTVHPCAILILADATTHDIDNTSFTNLQTQTTSFTVAGSYTDGDFQEKP